MKPPFILNKVERGSHVWRLLVEHLKEKRDRYREENDAPLDEVATAMKRGRIRELNELIALDDPAPGETP